MTRDAMESINEFRRRQLASANEIVMRCSQLCERVLESQGDRPDFGVLQLQHDCVRWNEQWRFSPINDISCIECGDQGYIVYGVGREVTCRCRLVGGAL